MHPMERTSPRDILNAHADTILVHALACGSVVERRRHKRLHAAKPRSITFWSALDLLHELRHASLPGDL